MYGFPFGKEFVDICIPQMFSNSTMIAAVAAEQIPSYMFVTFDADDVIVSVEGGCQPLLV